MINTASWPPLVFVSKSLCSFSLFPNVNCTTVRLQLVHIHFHHHTITTHLNSTRLLTL